VTGERHDTDIVDLAERAGARLYPVHRIDKVTSGTVLLARTLAAHGPLTRQFAARTAVKGYLAVVAGADLPQRWTIDLPLGVGRKNRVRIAAPREKLHFEASRWSVAEADVLTGKPTYPSVTEVVRLATTADRTLLLALPVTGRRHQIRVHLAWTGTPILGDPLFGPAGDRTHLHSWRLHLPDTPLDVEAAPDADFLGPVADVAEAGLAAAAAAWAHRLTR
jgi:tRNA pseudouridine32 synthase/23S rRNA pseudouridine746 synthase/23S rRNA pseudouridine1911/1915/1917 synthase